uniref:Uncharacterized protein n=1 Tax=Parascaris equorum TaxID=6256 RepID=A0A914REG8_PAREQ
MSRRIVEWHLAAREAVRQRAEALETAIEHSSQFTDRLDVILANLGGAAAQRCQKALDELRSKIDDIQPATGQPSLIEQQRTTLMARFFAEFEGIEVEMNDAQPLMSELRVAGRDLCEIVADEERAHVEQQIGAVEDNWATVTDIFARKNADLVDAMEKAMDFHGLLSELLEWLNETEEKLQSLEQLRSVLDEKAIQKEQLNQMCANLCADVNAHQHQSAVIRAPINDLNSRWNRLYASLNERQQKMERALLEMGQFSQAYEQLIGWIEKTEHVLDEVRLITCLFSASSQASYHRCSICCFPAHNVENWRRTYERSQNLKMEIKLSVEYQRKKLPCRLLGSFFVFYSRWSH